MKNKPFIFTVLSILCAIEPFIKVLYFKATTQFDFMVIFANLKARNTFMEVFDFWLVFPIAGLLILRLRKWTYFAFMSVLCYIMYNISTYEKYTWPYNSDAPFMYNYVVVGMAASVFLFFLFPKVRGPFFDRRLRWWEPQLRYSAHISCRVHATHLTFPSQILNISQSGAFLQDSPYLNVGDRLEMDFYFMGQTIEVPIEIVHKTTIKGMVGYGVKFNFRSMGQSMKVARVMTLLRRSNGLFKDLKQEKRVA